MLSTAGGPRVKGHAMPLGPYELVIHGARHVNHDDELSLIIEETVQGKHAVYKVYSESDPSTILYSIPHDGTLKTIQIFEGDHVVASIEHGAWGAKSKTVKGESQLSYVLEISQGFVKKKVRAVVQNLEAGVVDVNYKTATGNGEIYVKLARDTRRVIAEVSLKGNTLQQYTLRVAKGVDMLLLVTMILQFQLSVIKSITLS